MNYDPNKVDEAILALLYLTLHDSNRAWKGYDWDALDRLYQKGIIDNPRNSNKSVSLTEDGLRQCKVLFQKHFQSTESG